jgi:hypothetical protein
MKRKVAQYESFKNSKSYHLSLWELVLDSITDFILKRVFERNLLNWIIEF